VWRSVAALVNRSNYSKWMLPPRCDAQNARDKLNVLQRARTPAQNGRLAQLGERGVRNAEVTSSSLVPSTSLRSHVSVRELRLASHLRSHVSVRELRLASRLRSYVSVRELRLASHLRSHVSVRELRLANQPANTSWQFRDFWDQRSDCGIAAPRTRERGVAYNLGASSSRKRGRIRP
jgi:hypothetical protein